MSTVAVRELIDRGVLRVEDGNHGNDRPRPSEFVDEGIPFIRAADMTSGVVDFEGAGRINSVARARIRKGVGAGGDVILSHKGTVGRIAVAPMNAPDFVCSPQTTFWRSLDPGELDARYLRYQMLGAPFQRQLATLAGQTDMAPYVSLTDQRSMTLDVRPISEQRAIADVLGALDDKIAANHRVIAASDALAEARFDAAELRQEVALSGLARFVNGKPFTKNATGTGRVVIRIAELNSGLGGSTVYNDLEVPDDHVARPGDLLFAWSGSLTVARWYRPEAIVNQHIFKVIPNAGVPMWFVAQSVKAKLAEFRAIASDKATTMGHIQRHHLDLPVSVPAPDAVAAMDSMMTSLWDVALAREVENLRLEATRDELLPLLMSGKVRVRDAEKRVEEVL